MNEQVRNAFKNRVLGATKALLLKHDHRHQGKTLPKNRIRGSGEAQGGLVVYGTASGSGSRFAQFLCFSKEFLCLGKGLTARYGPYGSSFGFLQKSEKRLIHSNVWDML